MSFERMRALMKGLSPNSAYARFTLYDGAQWGAVEELLATVAEQVDFGNRLYYDSHRQAGERSWEPLKIRRPYNKQKPLRGDELVAAFKGLVDDEENPVVVYKPPPGLPAGGEN